MVLKVGFLLVFLFLFQSLEAKKKKQGSNITTQISSYAEKAGDFFNDAWDGFVSLLPANKKVTKKKKHTTREKTIIEDNNIKNITKTTKDKKSKHKKCKRNKWSLDCIMKTAQKFFSSMYNSVTGVFQRRSKRALDLNLDNEPSFEDVLHDILKDAILEFSKEHEIQEFKDS